MLPVVEGIIARRVLLNFAIDEEVARRALPEPLVPATQNGRAVAGICLIRLEQLRPKGLPSALGVSSENMAHRIAIRYPSDEGIRDGVFIWRRDTDRGLVSLLGGRLFPGVHEKATFNVDDADDGLTYQVRTRRGEADVMLKVRPLEEWPGSHLFPRFDEIGSFFKRGDCGYSCSLRGDRLEGIQLRTLTWDLTPLNVEEARSSFFQDGGRFPEGSVRLDGAVLMRKVPSEWHELSDIPEMASSR